jgi:hypothetical protein
MREVENPKNGQSFTNKKYSDSDRKLRMPYEFHQVMLLKKALIPDAILF